MAKLWLFDFDGTLVDSEKAIKACYLKVGQELVPERCDYIKTMVIGPTLNESTKMILTNKNLHLLEKYKNRFQEIYDDKLILETTQYPGADKTIRKLHANGDHLYIITNKRSYPTHKLIKYFNWNNLFKWVACIDEYPDVKTKIELLKIKKIQKKQYDDIFFVGDTKTDGMCANHNQIKFIKANYGYGKLESWHDINIFFEIEKIDELITNSLFS